MELNACRQPDVKSEPNDRQLGLLEFFFGRFGCFGFGDHFAERLVGRVNFQAFLVSFDGIIVFATIEMHFTQRDRGIDFLLIHSRDSFRGLTRCCPRWSFFLLGRLGRLSGRSSPRIGLRSRGLTGTGLGLSPSRCLRRR